MTVSNGCSGTARSSASASSKRASRPRCFALARAFLIAVGAPSIPAATKPCSARYRTFSPGPHPREDALEVGSGQDDGGIAALGHHLDDGAALVVGDGAGADTWRVKDDRRAGLVGRADRNPAHPAVSDIVADLEAEGVAIEGERCVRVGVREEGRVNGEVHGGHARTGSVTRASRFLIGLVTCFATQGAIPSVARASWRR